MPPRPDDDPDIAHINLILDRLRTPARLGTLAGEAQHAVSLCRLQIATVRENLRTALAEHPNLARESADAVLGEVIDRLATLADDLSFADPADTTDRASSLWRRAGPGTPLGSVELPDGRRINVRDELHADALFHEGYEAFMREPDQTRRRAIKQTLKVLLDLLQPGERGARVGGSGEHWPRVGCDPLVMLAVNDDLAALLAGRADQGQGLPDVWGASGVDRSGFPDMTPAMIAARLIARRLGYALETGWERVSDLLTDARHGGRAAFARLSPARVVNP
jgi:hypothetical protein